MQSDAAAVRGSVTTSERAHDSSAAIQSWRSKAQALLDALQNLSLLSCWLAESDSVLAGQAFGQPDSICTSGTGAGHCLCMTAKHVCLTSWQNMLIQNLGKISKFQVSAEARYLQALGRPLAHLEFTSQYQPFSPAGSTQSYRQSFCSKAFCGKASHSTVAEVVSESSAGQVHR